MIIQTNPPLVVGYTEPRKSSGLDFNSLLLHVAYFTGSGVFSCVVVDGLSPYWTGHKRAFDSLFAYGVCW